jgi:hypothetical protein
MAAGLVQGLQFENRVTRRRVAERFHCRSFRNREEALNLAGEAIEIRFENRRAQLGGKLAYGVATAPQSADEYNFAGCAGIAHPIGIAAGANQIRSPSELDRGNG